MECLRCGATLKDKTLVCNKCGFIVKGSRKLDNFQPQMTFEQTVEMATEDELRAMLYAIKRQRDASYVVEEELSPEEKVIASGRRWANASLICGIISLGCMILPGINIILSLIFFVIAFMGFGKSAGQKPTAAMLGLVFAIVSIAGGWLYNAMWAEDIMKMFGLLPKEAAEVIGEVVANS